MKDYYSRLRPEIQVLQPSLVEWRRQFHQQPELGFFEQLTAEFVSQKLTEWGIEHQTGIAKTGIVATIAGNQQGRVLAIRADMDALPITEENEVSYRSRHSGVMHACGHDGHTAILLGVACYLSQHRDFAGTVQLIFQPAEEGLGGAKAMIDAGVLKNVSVIIGLHLWNNLPLGTVGVRSGALMAASESFNCKILGRGGHGALPHQTVDAVVVAAHVINVLQIIVARNVDPLEPVVVTVGQLNGGTKRNVIASTAFFSGTVRFFNPSLGDFLPKRIEQVIAGICQLHGAGYEFEYQRISPPVINDAALAEMVSSVAISACDPESVLSNCQTLAGEDMALYLQEVPGCFFFLGSSNPEKGLDYPHHHPRFDFDETALGIGVEIFVRCVDTFAAFLHQKVLLLQEVESPELVSPVFLEQIPMI